MKSPLGDGRSTGGAGATAAVAVSAYPEGRKERTGDKKSETNVQRPCIESNFFRAWNSSRVEDMGKSKARHELQLYLHNTQPACGPNRACLPIVRQEPFPPTPLSPRLQ